jgi:hypothetical protein
MFAVAAQKVSSIWPAAQWCLHAAGLKLPLSDFNNHMDLIW